MTDGALSFDPFAVAGRRTFSGHRYREEEAQATVLPFRGSAPQTGHCLPHDGSTGPWPGTDGLPAGSRDHDAGWTATDSWSDGGAWDEGAQARPVRGAAAAAPAWGAEQAWNDQPSWNAEQNWNAEQSWDDGAAWNAGPDAEVTQAWNTRQTWQDPNWGAEQAWNSEQNWNSEHNWDAEQNRDADSHWAPEERWDSDPAWESGDEGFRPDADAAAAEGPARPQVIGPRPSRKTGAHRLPAPPHSLKGRAAVVAVAAGAVVAAGQAAMATPGQPSQAVDYEAAGQIHEIAAQSMSVADPAAAAPDAPQMLNIGATSDLSQFNDILQKGAKYAEDLAAAEAAKLRPLFAKFAAGSYTSGFGARWGVQHLGIDVAGPIGTPIYSVADGTVIEAGPAAGFGMWVRVLHDDGTVTVYGHIDTATVSQGERVMAGDQIATMGNRGFSTGPHVHFEVWLNGSDKIDPVPWLATRGIGLGPVGH